MKTKKQHIKSLRDIQFNIVTILNRVDKEARIPVWQLKIWGSSIKSAANFMQKELKRKRLVTQKGEPNGKK